MRSPHVVAPPARRSPRLLRWMALAALALGGLLLAHAPPPALDPAAHTREKHAEELNLRFHEAAQLLKAQRHQEAAETLQRVLQLAPKMPEAHVNMGFAMLGMNRSGEAVAAFEKALALRSAQANAYYGLAMAYEQAGELELALGAMRSYLHLSAPDERFHAKARAALWEWEERLGRHAPAAASGPRR